MMLSLRGPRVGYAHAVRCYRKRRTKTERHSGQDINQRFRVPVYESSCPKFSKPATPARCRTNITSPTHSFRRGIRLRGGTRVSATRRTASRFLRKHHPRSGRALGRAIFQEIRRRRGLLHRRPARDNSSCRRSDTWKHKRSASKPARISSG
jgi:hypothetical protein